MNADSLKQLIANCRRGRIRGVGFPSDWRPYSVVNPESGLPFTDASAWEYIAEQLEGGHAYEDKVLDTPQGAPAIVMHIRLVQNQPLLYVKVQVGASNVPIGRSFHTTYLAE